jgi:hypothetical protein
LIQLSIYKYLEEGQSSESIDMHVGFLFLLIADMELRKNGAIVLEHVISNLIRKHVKDKRSISLRSIRSSFEDFDAAVSKQLFKILVDGKPRLGNGWLSKLFDLTKINTKSDLPQEFSSILNI